VIPAEYIREFMNEFEATRKALEGIEDLLKLSVLMTAVQKGFSLRPIPKGRETLQKKIDELLREEVENANR